MGLTQARPAGATGRDKGTLLLTQGGSGHRLAYVRPMGLRLLLPQSSGHPRDCYPQLGPSGVGTQERRGWEWPEPQEMPPQAALALRGCHRFAFPLGGAEIFRQMVVLTVNFQSVIFDPQECKNSFFFLVWFWLLKETICLLEKPQNNNNKNKMIIYTVVTACGRAATRAAPLTCASSGSGT